MRNSFIFASLFIFGFSCNSAQENQIENQTVATNNTSVDPIENFDCATFFDKGDYSSICFIDSELPKYISGGCIFDFETKGNKQEQSIQIQFLDKNTTMLAEMHHNLNFNNYSKGIVTEVSNIGDAAFFDEHETDLKSLSTSSKDLHVRYRNITFVLFTEYQSNTEMPCFYTDDNLKAFAEKIIANL